MKTRKYTDEYVREKLIPAVQVSRTFKEVCNLLGVRSGGGTQDYLASVIRANDIDTSHFLGNTWAKGTKHSNRNYAYLRDEYSGFRIFLSKAKARSAKLSLTLDDLKSQWESQNGKCRYSNVDLSLPSGSRKQSRLRTASLDRIDSSKEYEVGNIQFISVACNFAKNNMSHEEMLEFCSIFRSS